MKSARLFFGIGLLLAIFTPAGAQPGGVITGRVVTEDGAGVANVTVNIMSINQGQPGGPAGRRSTATTDEDGAFRFTDLAPRVYTVNVFRTKEYAVQPARASEIGQRRYYRVGDNATITLVKGGVITGKVTTPEGEAMIGVMVGATMVRDQDGLPVRQSFGGRPRMTDDRGVYRLYGLVPGTYIVSARAGGYNAYEGLVPTYYPSATRETATEVTVMSDGEVGGVDIRDRSERGHAISGIVTGGGEPATPYTFVNLSLVSLATGLFAGSAVAAQSEGNNVFAIYGVMDGEYEIIARRGGYNNEESLASSPRRVTVKGGDVSGIEIKLAPLASISGRVVIEASQSVCENKSRATIEETLVSARRDEKTTLPSSPFPTPTGVVSDKGDFKIISLDAGHYRIAPVLLSENWYVKSIFMPSATPPQRTSAAKTSGNTDVTRSGVSVKAGDKLSGLTVTIAEGAAGIRGKIVPEKEGGLLPARLRVHLAPSEPTSADEALRYAETLARSDATFAFDNLSPGKYWLIARPVPDDEPIDRPALPVAWDGAERAKLKREAELQKIEIELKPCGRVNDMALRYQHK
jgi:hypothetical protein